MNSDESYFEKDTHGRRSECLRKLENQPSEFNFF